MPDEPTRPGGVLKTNDEKNVNMKRNQICTNTLNTHRQVGSAASLRVPFISLWEVVE